MFKRFAAVLCLVLLSSLAGCAPAMDPSTVAIARDEDPDKAVAQALAELGGIKQFVRDGQAVFIKANLSFTRHGEYYPGATTDSRVVEALVKQIQSVAKCDITIGDAIDNFDVTAKACGYAPLASRYNVKVVNLLDEPFVPRTSSNGMVYHLPKSFCDADVVINVPVLKMHQLTGITVGMKNYFGLLPIKERKHPRIDELLCDLLEIRKPDLVLADGMLCMEGQGPTGGQGVRMDIVIAGRDAVAVDAVSAAVMGVLPQDIWHIRYAAARNLGRADLPNIPVRGVPIDQVHRPFAHACWWLVIKVRGSNTLGEEMAELAGHCFINDRGGQIEDFIADRTTLDMLRRPRTHMQPFTARGRDDGRTVDFTLRYDSTYRDGREALIGAMAAWIRQNLQQADPDSIRVMPEIEDEPRTPKTRRGHRHHRKTTTKPG